MKGYIKVPRFIKEFASWKKKDINKFDMMQDKYKKEGCENIDKAIKSYERGMITEEETIELIIRCLE